VTNIINTKILDSPLQFVVNAEGNIPHALMGDEAHIRQILINLLGNAIKYTEEGQVSLSINAEPLDDESINLIFEIKDSGRGIKPEDIDKLFNEYFRADIDLNKNIEGVGLGLTITQELIRKMGGSIKVSSIYGKGSTFTVTVPQKIIIAGNDPMELAYGRNDEPAKFTAPNAKVMVVDDIGTNLVVAKGLLVPYDMDVFLYKSGAEAIESIRSEDFDIILMDQKMPGMSGLETLQHIREMGDGDSYYGKVPVIALTANAISGVRETLLENGFTDYLTKPIDTTKLNQVLAQWLPEDKIIQA
jgi:CheY-like chemotaxis protein